MVNFRQTASPLMAKLPQLHQKVSYYEYPLGVMMCAKTSRKAVNGKCTSPEAHHRHIMHKLFYSDLIAILICMVKSRCSLAVKFAVNLQQPYGSNTAVCAGGLFFCVFFVFVFFFFFFFCCCFFVVFLLFFFFFVCLFFVVFFS